MYALPLLTCRTALVCIITFVLQTSMRLFRSSAKLQRCIATVAVAQAQDWDGYTPLMEAAAQGHSAVAKQLLRAGADTTKLDKVRSQADPAQTVVP